MYAAYVTAAKNLTKTGAGADFPQQIAWRYPRKSSCAADIVRCRDARLCQRPANADKLPRSAGCVAAVLTSQMAMPAAICSTVFDDATGYSASVTNFAAVTTSTDNVFSSSTSAQIAAQTPSLSGSVADGYTGTIAVGLAV